MDWLRSPWLGILALACSVLLIFVMPDTIIWYGILAVWMTIAAAVGFLTFL